MIYASKQLFGLLGHCSMHENSPILKHILAFTVHGYIIIRADMYYIFKNIKLTLNIFSVFHENTDPFNQVFMKIKSALVHCLGLTSLPQFLCIAQIKGKKYFNENIFTKYYALQQSSFNNLKEMYIEKNRILQFLTPSKNANCFSIIGYPFNH